MYARAITCFLVGTLCAISTASAQHETADLQKLQEDMLKESATLKAYFAEPLGVAAKEASNAHPSQLDQQVRPVVQNFNRESLDKRRSALTPSDVGRAISYLERFRMTVNRALSSLQGNDADKLEGVMAAVLVQLEYQSNVTQKEIDLLKTRIKKENLDNDTAMHPQHNESSTAGVSSTPIMARAADGEDRHSLALERYMEIAVQLAHEEASATLYPEMQQYYRVTGQRSGWTAQDLRKYREALSASEKQVAQIEMKEHVDGRLEMPRRFPNMPETGRRDFALQAEFFNREIKLLEVATPASASVKSPDSLPSSMNEGRTKSPVSDVRNPITNPQNTPGSHRPATRPEWLKKTREMAKSAEPVPPLHSERVNIAAKATDRFESREGSLARVVDKGDDTLPAKSRWTTSSGYGSEFSSIVVDECERQFPGVQLSGEARTLFENRPRGSRATLDRLRNQLDDFHLEQAIRKHQMRIDGLTRLIREWRDVGPAGNQPDKIVYDHWTVDLRESQQELAKLKELLGKGRVVNRSSKTLWVVETDSGPAIAHKLAPGHQSPRSVDADGFRAVDGTLIDGHKSWVKISNLYTANVTDRGSELTRGDILSFNANDTEFGKVTFDSAEGWGESLSTKNVGGKN